MSNKRDQIYQHPRGEKENENAKSGSFRFDARVADVFSDMISRSVPGYLQILDMLPTLVKQYRQQSIGEQNYYDLGCSLGAGMLAIAKGVNDSSTTTTEPSVNIIGIDNSEAMLAQAETTLAPFNQYNFELITQDIQKTDINNAAMVLMNFTLQFIPLVERDALIKKIYDGLLPNGTLVLSEKIKFDDPKEQQALIDIHHQYKADQGYSQLEIAQKRDAIEDVLIPETLAKHTERLSRAGFSVITPWVQNLQFISILAVK